MATQLERVRSACLTLATRLGSLLDEVVVIGGLVPSLIIEQHTRDAHVGTSDLDLGLHLAILEESRYTALVAQLHASGFEPDVDHRGKLAPYRWIHRRDRITVDFLIAPSGEGTSRLRTIDAELSAFVAPGLPLAFLDNKTVTLTGTTLDLEEASRELRVCGAGAFVLLKALAFKGRGENKDAYDLLYVLREYGVFLTDIAASIRPLLTHAVTREALDVLGNDFTRANHAGPMRAAAFLSRSQDDAWKEDAAAMVNELLRLITSPPASRP
ncbi:MAG: hypothetical protein ACO1OB_34445 [Archangium sp.]